MVNKRLADVLEILLVLCAILIFVSCTRCGPGELPELDVSLISGAPCVVPCWYNITPGVSGEDDVRAALMGSPFIREGSLSSSQTTWQGVAATVFDWKARGVRDNRVYLRDGTVQWIEIVPDYRLPLGQVVDEFGPPENVHAFVGGEDVDYIVRLDYPAQGVSFSSVTDVLDLDDVIVEQGIAILSQDLSVTKVFYYAPTSLEGVLRDVFLYPEETVEYHLGVAQEWTGFGSVQLAPRTYIRH